MSVKIGIIGGSGLDDPNLIENSEEVNVETPYGYPSSLITTGKIYGVDVCILSRHGKDHSIPPTQVNNKANIHALKKLGCTHILTTTAVGSLKEEIKRGDFVILDQFIDFTKHRKTTFHESFSEEGPKHTPMANAFSSELRQKLIQVCRDLGFEHHDKGTVITIEGPRFSTIAESKMFQSWGADVINMSIAPEAILANEAEIPYASIAMSTDYDCWKQDEAPVSWEAILEIFNKNAERVKQVLLNTIKSFSDETKHHLVKSKIRTVPHFPKEGIMFRDITTLFKDPEGLKHVADIFYERYKNYNIDIIAGIESRGFIVGGMLAEKLNLGFVPIRKKGKLPAETVSEEYTLEYGTDIIEIHKDAIHPNQKVLLVDDLIATGGTAEATCKLIEKIGGKIVECAFIINLPDLGGLKKVSQYPTFSIVEFEGE